MSVFYYLREKNVLKFTLIVFLTSMSEVWSYYSNFEGAPMFLLRASMLCSFLYFIYSKAPPKFSARLYFLFVFSIMILSSLFNKTSTTPFLTITAISSMMISGTLSKRLDLDLINKSMILLSIITGILVLYQLSTTDIDIDILLNRGYTWTELFSYASLLNFYPILFFTSIITGRGLVFSISIWLLVVVVQSIFLKRMIFVDSFLMLIITYYYLRKNGNLKIARLLLLLLVTGIVVWVLDNILKENATEILDTIKNRFYETSDDLSSFDRFTETKNYFKFEASVIDVFFGKGFLSAHTSLNEEKYFLHIGWANWIFKGGILLFLGILVIYFKVFRCFRHINKFPHDIQFALLFSMFMFFRLFYSNIMGFDSSLFFFFYTLMAISDYKISPTLNYNIK